MAVEDAAVESPLWWTWRLYRQLVDRQPSLELYGSYYRGDHPLPWLPQQIQDMARRILKMTRTNYMGLVVDATTERLEVLGFRVGDTTEGDDEAFRIWQANNLDSISSEAFLEAATSGSSYWLVSPNRADPATPKVTVEHPAQMIVDYEPGDVRARAAALKLWFDTRTRQTMATLYLPDWVYKFQGPKDSKPDKWEPRRVEGEEWPVRNPFGVVPVVEMRNNPQTVYCDGELAYVGVSELADVIDIQDRINKTVADRLVTQDFGAFPQKWATGWGEDEDTDTDSVPAVIPGTGGQVRHPAGRVNFGRDRLVVATDDNVRFGQWEAAALDPYSNAKNEDVKDIAARTRTPSQYLLGEMINISGEALQSAESGLVSKILQRRRAFGETLEEVVRLYLLAAGDPRADDLSASTIWRDPEFRTIGQLSDAVIKKHLAGLISWDQAMEDLGYTPRQIERNRRDKRKDALEGAALNFDGLFNAPKLGNASDNSLLQSAAGAPPNPSAAAVSAPGDTSGQTKSPAPAPPGGVGA